MRLRTLRHYDIEWTMAQEQVDRTETSMHRKLPVRSCSAGATDTQIGKHENIHYKYIIKICQLPL